jgi:uncharacterized protein RhaS with RHS repeats
MDLYYLRGRYYSQELHRFISRDPIGFAGGDANLYAYVGNSPTNFSDPRGLYVEGGLGSNLSGIGGIGGGGIPYDVESGPGLQGGAGTIAGGVVGGSGPVQLAIDVRKRIFTPTATPTQTPTATPTQTPNPRVQTIREIYSNPYMGLGIIVSMIQSGIISAQEALDAGVPASELEGAGISVSPRPGSTSTP